jgi:hypothetical protein
VEFISFYRIQLWSLTAKGGGTQQKGNLYYQSLMAYHFLEIQEELSNEFWLPVTHRLGLIRLITAVPRPWINWLTVDKAVTKPKEWLGIFEFHNNDFPIVVTQTMRKWMPSLTEIAIELQLGPASQYFVMRTSGLLSPTLTSQETRPFVRFWRGFASFW